VYEPVYICKSVVKNLHSVDTFFAFVSQMLILYITICNVVCCKYINAMQGHQGLEAGSQSEGKWEQTNR